MDSNSRAYCPPGFYVTVEIFDVSGLQFYNLKIILFSTVLMGAI